MHRTVALALMCALPAFSMTLEEAVDTALENRNDITAARSDLSAAEWQRRSADLWFLPSVSFSAAFVRSHDISVMEIPGMGSIPMGSEYASQAGITAAVPLFTARGLAGSGLAEASEELAAASLEGTRQDATLEVIQSFNGVLLASELLNVSEEALSIAEEGFTIANQRFEAGTISRFELLESSVSYENRKPEALAAANSVANARAAFAVAIGMSSTADIPVEGDLSTPISVTLPSSLEEAMRMMEENSPELRTAASLREIGDASVDMAGAAFAPSVILQTEYAYQATRDDWHFEMDDYDRAWTTTLAVEIPIFDQLGDLASYQSARAGRLASTADARSLEDYSELGLVQAWNDLARARESVSATGATVAQAEEGSSIARVSYEAGVITRLEMDQAFLALTASRTNHAMALFDLRGAEARLARAMGLLVLE
jgi:outer membrane protein TolC